jgi:hypothetical protein
LTICQVKLFQFHNDSIQRRRTYLVLHEKSTIFEKLIHVHHCTVIMATLTKSRPTTSGKQTKIKKTVLVESPDSTQEAWDKELTTPRAKALLSEMAAKALADHKAGKTERGGFGK